MNFDAFRTIAEIAIALTGFIGIVVVLQPGDKAFSRLSIYTIMGTSLGTVLFAFLPDLLDEVLGSEATWRVACGSFGFYHLHLIINQQVKQRAIRPNTPIQLAITLLSLPVVALKIAVGLGFLLPYAYDIYYLGLLWCVGIAGYLFATLLFDATGSTDERA